MVLFLWCWEGLKKGNAGCQVKSALLLCTKYMGRYCWIYRILQKERCCCKKTLAVRPVLSRYNMAKQSSCMVDLLLQPGYILQQET